MRNRKNFPVPDLFFIPVPNKILKIPCPYAKLVFLAMMDGKEEYNPTLQNISQLASISINSVRKGIATLIAYNIICLISQYQVGKSARCYKFTDPNTWKL